MISVIVPIYNAEKTLHRCVDSILAQTHTDFELLLVNDGSKDNSGVICDEYARKDSRVRVFHRENGGVSSARNLGLDNMRGEWVTFVDSDDYIGCEYLSVFVQDLSVDLVLNTSVVNANNNSFVDNIISAGRYAKKDILNLYLDDIRFMCVSNKLFCVKFLFNIRFKTTMRLGEDTLFTYEYLSIINKIRVFNSNSYQRAYFYDFPIEGLAKKYYLSVQESVHSLTSIYDAYTRIGVICPNTEFGLPYMFYEYCKEDMKSNGKYWYGNYQIKKICVRKSAYVSRKAKLITKLLFFPGVYEVLKLLKIK